MSDFGPCRVPGCDERIETNGCVRCPAHAEAMAPLAPDPRDAEILALREKLAAAERERDEKVSQHSGYVADCTRRIGNQRAQIEKLHEMVHGLRRTIGSKKVSDGEHSPDPAEWSHSKWRRRRREILARAEAAEREAGESLEASAKVTGLLVAAEADAARLREALRPFLALHGLLSMAPWPTPDVRWQMLDEYSVQAARLLAPPQEPRAVEEREEPRP